MSTWNLITGMELFFNPKLPFNEDYVYKIPWKSTMPSFA